MIKFLKRKFAKRYEPKELIRLQIKNDVTLPELAFLFSNLSVCGERVTASKKFYEHLDEDMKRHFKTDEST